MSQAIILVVIGLLVYLALGDDIKRLLRRRTETYRVKYTRYLTRSVLVPALVFAALGVLMRDIFLTPVIFVVGGWLTYTRIRYEIAQSGAISPRMVSQLVIAFRGAYQLEPAAFKSLEEAGKKIGEPLRSIVDRVVDVYFATSDPERAFQELRQRSSNVLLHQFAYVLEMSESASDESVTDALDAFTTRLRRQEELQREVETNLASVTGQTSFMQALAIIIAFTVAIIPGFRDAYVGSLLGRLGYVIIVLVIAAASHYIEKKVFELKEQIV